MNTVRAVYEGGVLRPVGPLALDEGEAVEITVARCAPAVPPSMDPEIARRIEAARTVAEWVEATKLLPDDDGGYDILRALNHNRAAAGERSLTGDGEAVG